MNALYMSLHLSINWGSNTITMEVPLKLTAGHCWCGLSLGHFVSYLYRIILTMFVMQTSSEC